MEIPNLRKWDEWNGDKNELIGLKTIINVPKCPKSNPDIRAQTKLSVPYGGVGMCHKVPELLTL